MKNTYTLKMEIEQEGKDDIIVKIIGNKHPKYMSNSELIGFIECLKSINNTCIDVSNERIRNGKSKNKKEQR